MWRADMGGLMLEARVQIDNIADVAFFVGFKLDVRLILFLLLPVMALWRLPPLDPAKRPEAVRLWSGHLAFVICLVVFFYVLDFANYDWLNERIDVSRLNDAGNFEISWRVAWESYPVGWTLLGLLGLGAGFFFVLAWSSWLVLTPPRSRQSSRPLTLLNLPRAPCGRPNRW